MRFRIWHHKANDWEFFILAEAYHGDCRVCKEFFAAMEQLATV